MSWMNWHDAELFLCLCCEVQMALELCERLWYVPCSAPDVVVAQGRQARLWLAR